MAVAADQMQAVCEVLHAGCLRYADRIGKLGLGSTGKPLHEASWHADEAEKLLPVLAAQRRATVARIERAYLASWVPDSSEEFYRGVDAASANLRRVLAAEAQR